MSGASGASSGGGPSKALLLLLLVPPVLGLLAWLLGPMLAERLSRGSLALVVTVPFVIFLLVLWRMTSALQQGGGAASEDPEGSDVE
ncbi:MAG: hypothetical protein AAF533_28285 [Acidobacteriota bacterium]